VCLEAEKLTLRRDTVDGAEAISTLPALEIILDVAFQPVIYHSMHPGAASVVGPIFICLRYAASSALTTGVTRAMPKTYGVPRLCMPGTAGRRNDENMVQASGHL
jgi:hypothetical protein